MIENPINAIDDELRCDRAQTFQRLRVTAGGLHAGNARQFVLQNLINLTVGTRASRLSRSEKRDHWFAQRGGHMHRARIIGHDQFAESYPFDHFLK